MSSPGSSASSVKGDDKAPENEAENKVDEVLDAFSSALRTAVKRILDGDTKTDTEPADDRNANERVTYVSEVRKVGFEQFKNSFQKDPKIPAVEALVVGNNLVYDVRRDLLKRTRAAARDKKGGPKATSSAASSEVPPQLLPEDGWVQRIRIRSPSVLGYLAREAGQTWASEDPFTFVKPFRVPIYFQPGMCRALERLEQRWHGLEEAEAERLSTTASPAPESVKDGGDAVPEKHASSGVTSDVEGIKPLARTRTGQDTSDSQLNSLEALRDMRAYVHFIDKEIMPLTQKFDGLARQQIRFDELWLLFKPGEILHSPPREEIKQIHRMYQQTKEVHIKSYQELYRTYGVVPPADETTFLTTISRTDKDDKKEQWYNPWGQEKILPKFEVTAYYIDFDGTSYAPAQTNFNIDQYEGEKRIDSLPCYPLRFAPDEAKILEEHTDRGRAIQKFYCATHLAHSGWSLGHNPDGAQLKKETEWSMSRPIIPEYIDGTVIIDVAETLNNHPQFKPDFRVPLNATENWELTPDDVAFHWYTSYDRSKLDTETPDVVMTKDGVVVRQEKTAMAADRFLDAFMAGRSAQRYNPRERPLPDELLKFLPKRMFAYVLRERMHILLDVRNMSIVPLPKGVFDSLKIPRTKKDMIRGLVRTHFDKKALKAKMETLKIESLDQDLIRGKGNGLVILLHGAPGVGKTATAEAVAIETKQPLFAISCGDVGTDAERLEARLDDIFRLANKWNCVLLFDEADVFLSQRNKLDVKRNALVSCFLRALEYYSGILFLTTNRVGTFDEAFTSRIHLSLHYPQLNEVQTTEIFRANIARIIDVDSQRATVNNVPPLLVNKDAILEFGRQQYLVGAASSGGNNPAAARRRPGMNPVTPDPAPGAVAWNGRQIRNAFQIAASLAYHSASTEHALRMAEDPEAPPVQPVLDDSQFKEVAETTRAFNEYLTQTRGYTDAELAGVGGIRADAWRDSQELQILLETQRQRRQQRGGEVHWRHMHASAEFSGGMSGISGGGGMAGLGVGEGMGDHRRHPSTGSPAYGPGGISGDGYGGQAYLQSGHEGQQYRAGHGVDATYALRPGRAPATTQVGVADHDESYD